MYIDILPNLETDYDLILLIDILEHFDYEEGMKLMEECKKRGKNIIISTPKDIGSQKDAFGNRFETHKFQWRKKHFDKFVKRFYVPNEYSLIYYIGDDASKVKSNIKMEILISALVLKFLTIPYRILSRALKSNLLMLSYTVR